MDKPVSFETSVEDDEKSISFETGVDICMHKLWAERDLNASQNQRDPQEVIDEKFHVKDAAEVNYQMWVEENYTLDPADPWRMRREAVSRLYMYADLFRSIARMIQPEPIESPNFQHIFGLLKDYVKSPDVSEAVDG